MLKLVDLLSNMLTDVNEAACAHVAMATQRVQHDILLTLLVDQAVVELPPHLLHSVVHVREEVAHLSYSVVDRYCV